MPRTSLLGFLVLGLAGSGFLGGCDNPTCVFVDGCRNGAGGGGNDPGGLGTATATFPEEGAFLAAGPPRLVAVGPGPSVSDALHPESPLFFEFSESLDPSTLEGAFRIVDLATFQPIPTLPPELVGDGRVAVLVPNANAAFLPGRRYQVIYGEEPAVRDLNGQALDGVTEEPLIEFGVLDPMDVPTPVVVYTFPNDFSTNASGSSEFIVGFDRPMNAATFNGDTFDVTVDGQPPVVDPAPAPITVGPGGVGGTATQVWRWTPLDGNGRPISVGSDVQVVVRLSSGAGQILAEDGSALPVTESQYQTLDVGLPLAVTKSPGAGAPDGFGRADVFGGAPIVEVTLAEPAPGGIVADAFLFGNSPNNPELLRSIVSTVDVPTGATSLQLTANDLGLFDGAGLVQFADGDFECAVQLRRNAFPTGVRRFDGDRTTPEIERPFFDTVAPVLLGLGATGADTSMLVSDVRDFAAVGRASEPIEFAFVDSGPLGTNGGSLDDPPATAFTTSIPGTDESLFIAAPVPLGALDPSAGGASYSVTVFDRAGNAAELTAVGTFTQRGVLGPGGAPTNSTVTVRVYDERTLAPISGALVFSHAETGGAVTFVGQAQTDATGTAQVPGASAGDTLITADANGFDLFTFHGVPRDQIDVLVSPVGGGLLATVEGTISSTFPTANFSGDNTIVADTRAPRLSLVSQVAPCSADPTTVTYRCDYGPATIVPSQLGASTFFATQDSIAQTSFSPAGYLRGFAQRGPLAPVGPGGMALGVDLDAGDLLLLAPLANQPLPTPPVVLDIGGLANLGTLEGSPFVTIEGVAAGLAGPLVVGRGNPYDLAQSTWTVLGAIAGPAGPAGELVTRGAIDPDLFVRARLVDTDGNQVAARPRASSGSAQIAPIDVPRFLVPGPGGSTGGDAYNIQIEDTLPDSVGGDGLVRVVVTGPDSRRWILWGLDTSDAAGPLLLSVPEIASQGGMPLADGAQTAEVRLWGAPIDRGQFLWSDLEREHEVFGRAAPVTFTQD
ncbi:MAG: carboxypeptidase-like regulatory domain-containing protein [Planctomycetota bacterium]